MKELNITQSVPPVFCDNKAAVHVVNSRKDCDMVKELCAETLRLRQRYRNNAEKIHFIRSEENVSDIIPKNLPTNKVQEFRKHMIHSEQLVLGNKGY